jgi:hypothetical protein
MVCCENALNQNAAWPGRRENADRTPDQPLQKDATMPLARNSGGVVHGAS